MKIHQQGCDCFECQIPYIAKLHQKFNKPALIGIAGRTDTKDKGVDNFAKDFAVQWNTEPIIGNPLTALWSDYWSAKTWINWHKAVKAKYGKDRANEVFIIWWEKAPPASPTTDFRSFDNDFIQYAKQEGFYNALFKGLGGLIGKTASTANQTVNVATDVVGAAGDAIDDLGGVITFLTKNLKYVLIFVVIMIIIYFYINLKKTV